MLSIAEGLVQCTEGQDQQSNDRRNGSNVAKAAERLVAVHRAEAMRGSKPKQGNAILEIQEKYDPPGRMGLLSAASNKLAHKERLVCPHSRH